MSDQAAREAVARMAIDPQFRDAVGRRDPAVLAGLDLTEDERERLRALSTGDSGGGPESMGQRLSKSSILGGSLLSHLSEHGGASAAVQEQHHAAAVATPWSPGHGPAGPDVPGSDGPWSPGHGPDGSDGPDLPHHGSQGSGSETPFRTGGSSGEGDLPTGRGGDDTPHSDVSVHHDDHHFHSDGRAGKGDADTPDKPAGDDSSGVQHPNVTTSWSQGGGDSKTVHDNSDGSSHVVTYHGADHSTDIVDHYSGGGGLSTHVAADGTVTNHLDMGWGSPHHDGGPDGGTESGGPAVDPTWASQQHTGPATGPESGQEGTSPNLDPAAASKVGAGGSGTGGEGGVEEGHASPLTAGEASTTHIQSNDTGYGTASYGKVDPNPVEH